VLALVAVTGGTIVALALLEFALWTHQCWCRGRERRTRDVPPLAVLATRAERGDARDLEMIENDLTVALLAGEIPPAAYADGMAWLAGREDRFGFTESQLPPSFRADA
jgi:hypothetical protein